MCLATLALTTVTFRRGTENLEKSMSNIPSRLKSRQKIKPVHGPHKDKRRLERKAQIPR